MRHTTDIALTAIGPISWGTTYAVTTELLPPDRPLTAALLRALPAGVLALVITGQFPRGRWLVRALVLGALNIGLFFPLLFVAAYRLPGGPAAILGAAAPFVVALLARPLLGERATTGRFLWATVALLGISLVVLTARAQLDAVGVAAGLAATVSMSVGTVLTKRWGRPVGVTAFAGWQLMAGGLVVLPIALAVEGLPDAVDAGAVVGYAWLGLVGALLAYTLWFRGLALLPAGQAAFLPLLSPIVAAFVGWMLLEDDLTPLQLLGMLIAFVAIVAAQRTSSTRRQEPVRVFTPTPRTEHP